MPDVDLDRSLAEDELIGELAVPDNPTYSVVDLSAIAVSEAVFEKLWPELFAAYGLRRLKGCFINDRLRDRKSVV